MNAPSKDDGTLWFPELTEDHGRRDGAMTIVGLNPDGAIAIADNAWHSENDTAVLRTELCIPETWLLESVSYDLGAFRPDLRPFTLAVHGLRISAHAASVAPSGAPTQVFTVNGGTIERPAGEPVPVHPFTVFINDSAEYAVALGGLPNVDELHAAGRLPLYFCLLALSQRIYRPGSPVYAERRWHPTLGKREYIGGCEQPHTGKNITKADTSFSIFNKLDQLVTQGGRPDDSGVYDEASEPRFFEDLGKAAHAAVRAGESLNYTSLARHGLAGDPRTVGKYVKRFGYDLKKIETEAVRCTQRLVICQFHVRRRAEFKKKGA